MALPSSVFSCASRLFSLRPSHLTRMVHSGLTRLTTQARFSETNKNTDKDEDFSESEQLFVQDIDVDDTLAQKDFFGVRNLFSTELLFQSRVHYGHKGTALDPGMKQFVYGIRAGQVVFDLDITAYHLQQALNFTAHIALRGGIILFIARLPHCAHWIENTAKECGEYAHTRYWMDGTLLDLNIFQGLDCRPPDLVILLSTLSEFGTEHLAIRDCAKLNIPTIAIVDSNCCPDMITYPVPGNDDSEEAIKTYCSLFSKAIKLGKKERASRFEQLEKEVALEEVQRKTKISWTDVK